MEMGGSRREKGRLRGKGGEYEGDKMENGEE